MSEASPLGPPFLRHLGARLRELPEASEVTIDLRPELCNSRGVAHGGVLMTLLDTSMARSVRARQRADGEPDMGANTIEMKSAFMSPASGPVLVARGHCVHRTATLAFCEAEIRNSTGELVARGSGTFKFIKPKRKTE